VASDRILSGARWTKVLNKIPVITQGAGEPYITTLDEFNAIIRRDYEMHGKVIKDVGVTVD
jgi:hypothetical protein